VNTEQTAALREPFAPEQIGKLPRKGTAGLDYVGHAAVTDRLLSVDPEWSWEPVAFSHEGDPLICRRENDAVMWIRLTVCDVTRLGVGIVAASAFELEKQLISDALRNAAMRFGVALDLWSKESLPEHHDPGPVVLGTLIEDVKAGIAALASEDAAAFRAWKDDQGFPWPWPMDACNAMLRELDKLSEAAAFARVGTETDPAQGTGSMAGEASGMSPQTPEAPAELDGTEPF
jgi:hypothetical protein